MLVEALEAEITGFLLQHADLKAVIEGVKFVNGIEEKWITLRKTISEHLTNQYCRKCILVIL